MRKFRILFLLTLSSMIANAQVVNMDWAKSIGGPQIDQVFTGNIQGAAREVSWPMTTDYLGNIYVTGVFYGTSDMDPGPGVHNLTASGNADNFIVKLDPNGDFIWARSFDGNAAVRVYSIACDADGNLLLTGQFKLTADFDPDTTVYNLTSNGSEDLFVMKVDSSGSLDWAFSTGSTYIDAAYGIVSDGNNNVYLTGRYFGTVDFDPGPGIFTLESVGAGRADVFLIKLDQNGNFIWARSFGGVNDDYGYSIATDDFGNLILTGEFGGTSDFDPDSASVLNLTSNGIFDVFVASIDTSGDLNWAHSFGSTSADKGYDVTTDPSGNVLVVGVCSGTVDFDPGPGISNVGGGSRTPFALKLDSMGNFHWAKGWTGTMFFTHGNRVETDAAGNVYICGLFHVTNDFDPDSGVYNLSTLSTLPWDPFVLRLNEFGNFNWAISFQGLTYVSVGSLIVNAAGDLYVSGDYGGSVDMDPGASVQNLNANGSSSDVFVTKLSQSLVGIDEDALETPYRIYPNPSYGQYYIDSGNAKDVTLNIYNMNGQLVLDMQVIHKGRNQVELDLNPGIYFAELNADGISHYIKIVKL